MGDDESFIARWSRRKRRAALQTRDEPKPESAAGGAAPKAAAAPSPPGDAQPAFDLASLPPVDSIGAGSDIRAFLAAGVPADLMRAALRRAWSADPAIRDFVGLSENSWDFNAPTGVPGFGSMKAQDVRQLSGQTTSEGAADSTWSAVEPLPADQATASTNAPRPEAEVASLQPTVQNSAKNQLEQDRGEPTRRAKAPAKAPIAERHEPGRRESRPPLPQRVHGGAPPK